MAEEHISFRWGIPWLDEKYLVTPNFFFDHYIELGVNRPEFLFVLHLARYRFESAAGVAKPSLELMAKQMGYGRRQVQRMVSSLESKGWLVVTERPGKASEYNFEALARALLRKAESGDNAVTRDIHDTPTLDTHVQGTLDTHVTRRRRREEEEVQEKRVPQDTTVVTDLSTVEALVMDGYTEKVAKGMVTTYGEARVMEVLGQAIEGDHLAGPGDWIRRELARGEEEGT